MDQQIKVDSNIASLSVQSDETEKKRGELIEVARKGVWSNLDKLLKKFAREGFCHDFFIRGRQKHLLHLVAELGHTVMLQRLIDNYKIDVNVLDNQGRSPLYYAIMASKLPAVKFLVAHNANRFLATKDRHYLPIHIAAETGDEHIISFLLDKQKSEGTTEYDQISKLGTPLEVAVQYGHFKAVEIFLKHNYKGIFRELSENALMRAIQIGRLDILKLLVKDDQMLSDDIFYRYSRCNGETPLGLATSLGQDGIVKWLINHKADPNAPSRDGRLPFEIAKSTGDIELSNFLLQKTSPVLPPSGKIEALWSRRKISASQHHYKLAIGDRTFIKFDDRTFYQLYEAHNMNASDIRTAAYLIFCQMTFKRDLNKASEKENIIIAYERAAYAYRKTNQDQLAVKAFQIASHLTEMLQTEMEPSSMSEQFAITPSVASEISSSIVDASQRGTRDKTVPPLEKSFKANIESATARESRQALQVETDPTTELLSWISKNRYEDAFKGALEKKDVTIVFWLCSQVDLQEILSRVPLPLSQAVLLSLLQQLAFGLSQETPQKLMLSWMSDITVAVDPSDPMIVASVSDIMREVYGVLCHHQRGLTSLMDAIRIKGSLKT